MEGTLARPLSSKTAELQAHIGRGRKLGCGLNSFTFRHDCGLIDTVLVAQPLCKDIRKSYVDCGTLSPMSDVGDIQQDPDSPETLDVVVGLVGLVGFVALVSVLIATFPWGLGIVEADEVQEGGYVWCSDRGLSRSACDDLNAVAAVFGETPTQVLRQVRAAAGVDDQEVEFILEIMNSPN